MIDIKIPEIQLHQRGMGAGGKQKSLQDLGRNIYVAVGVNTKFRKFQRTYVDDRIAYVYDCLPALRKTFAPYQEEVLGYFDSGERRVAVRGPHGLGKTLLAAIIVHHTLLTTEEDSKVPTLASVGRQLERYLWPEIHKIAGLIDWHQVGRDPYSRDELMTLSIRLRHEAGLSEAFAVSAGSAADIEGAHASRLFYVFDEAKTIEKEMWNAAEGAFSTEGAVLIGSDKLGECYWFAISTPGPPTGEYYNIHSHKEGYENWRVRHVTLDEAIKAGMVGAEWVELCRKKWGEHSAVYQNRVLGEFATDQTTSTIPLSWIEAAFDRYGDWVDSGKLGEGLGLRILGVDTARYGDDTSVVAERVGDRLEKMIQYPDVSVPVMAGYVKNHGMTAAEVRIEMDSGLGAGVYDIIESERTSWENRLINLIPVYMGAGISSMDSTNTFRFNCVRSAAYWHMRELLDPDGPYKVVLCPDDELLGDLSAPRYEIKYMFGHLTIAVEPKENIKKQDRLGRSPDKGDAVVLAYWDGNAGGGGVVI